MIPYIIHQIYIDKNNPDCLPPQKFFTEEYIYSIEKFNPGCQHKIWTSRMILKLIDDNPCLHPYKDFYNDDLSLSIEKCDLARLFVVYVCGGMYLDNKAVCLMNLKPLFDQRSIVLIQEWHDIPPFCDNAQVSNAVFAAEKYHPFIYSLINYIFLNYQQGKKTIYDQTGPVIWGKLAVKLGILTPPPQYFNRLTRFSAVGRWKEDPDYFLHPCTMMSRHGFIEKLCKECPNEPRYLYIDFSQSTGWMYSVWVHYIPFLLEKYHLPIMLCLLFLLFLFVLFSVFLLFKCRKLYGQTRLNNNCIDNTYIT